jgi:hypothetical protein
VAGFTCSLLELDVVGEAFGVNVRQFPIEVPVHGENLDERRRFGELATRNLIDKSLYDGRDFDPEFTRSVNLYARGELSIAMVGQAGEREYEARASTDGQYAVLAVAENQQVRFEPVSPTGLVRAMVSLLPPMKPGPGASVSTVIAEPEQPRRFRRDDDTPGEQSWLEPARSTRDSAGAQSAAIDAILRRPRLGAGSFLVTARGRNGHEGTPVAVNWLDTDAGRYMLTTSQGGDGRTHVAYIPADQAHIDEALTRHLHTMA